MAEIKDKENTTNSMMWIWYCLIFTTIAWRYVFNFMIDKWSPMGIFLVNSMVLIIIIMDVSAIIFGITPRTKIGN